MRRLRRGLPSHTFSTWGLSPTDFKRRNQFSSFILLANKNVSSNAIIGTVVYNSVLFSFPGFLQSFSDFDVACGWKYHVQHSCGVVLDPVFLKIFQHRRLHACQRVSICGGLPCPLRPGNLMPPPLSAPIRPTRLKVRPGATFAASNEI